jgi:hypothetical protein
LNTSQSSEPDLENGNLHNEIDINSPQVHMQDGYAPGGNGPGGNGIERKRASRKRETQEKLIACEKILNASFDGRMQKICGPV